MQITMLIVASADGKMTRGSERHVHAWTSKEDAAFFTDMVGRHDGLIMGRATYEAVRPKPQPGFLRVVMTHEPEKYNNTLAKPGSLEFTAEQPQALADRLGRAGYTSMMLVGGRSVYSTFLRAGLVNDFYLTVEPVLFGAGATMLADIPVDIRMELQDMRPLNNQGTVLLHYRLKPAS